MIDALKAAGINFLAVDFDLTLIDRQKVDARGF